MGLELLLVAASAVLGFAAGVWIRKFVLELVSLAVAFSVAAALQLNGFGFRDGALPLIGALLSSQIAYLAGMLIRSRTKLRSLLEGEVLDNGPDSRGKSDIGNDQEKHGQGPA
jgi:hypothetical protein